MFESIQDYMAKIIDKDKLVEALSLCEEYQEAELDIKSKLDLFIEDIKDAKTDQEVLDLLKSDVLYNLGFSPDSYKLLDLATRIVGNVVPLLVPAQLAAFIELCIEHNDDERLFRLAYNYNDILFDKTKFEDYYIKHNNIFYINEIACKNLIGIHYDRLVDTMAKSNQLDELKYFAENINNKNVDITKVLNRIKELEN